MKRGQLLVCVCVALGAWLSAATQASPAPPAPVVADVDFQVDVLPILERSCFRCHAAVDDQGRPRNAKGGLRLDGAGWIGRGGDGGAVLVPGQAARSTLWTRTVLDANHLDVMPAKGELLSQAETDALAAWINAGADFGRWTGEPGPVVATPAALPAATGAPARVEQLLRLAQGLEPASREAIAAACGPSGRAAPALPGGPLLRIDFVSHEADVSDADIERLAPLAHHVAQLDLGRTGITDRALAAVARMPRMARLDLHATVITDGGLAHLGRLSELRYLNLYGTSISDSGLQALAGLTNLRALHLWGTDVTQAGVAALQQRLPLAVIHHVRALPPPPPRERDDDEDDEGGRRRRRG